MTETLTADELLRRAYEEIEAVDHTDLSPAGVEELLLNIRGDQTVIFMPTQMREAVTEMLLKSW